MDFDPASTDVSIRKHVEDGVLSAQSSPLVSRSGKPIGMVSTHWRESGHRPSQRELRFLDLLARQAADFIEQSQAQKALRMSEENYRTLFESIDEGFCTIEVLFDAHEQAVDYRFLQVNPAFERQTGIEKPKGRCMREIAPQHEEHWFEIYGRVAQTGEPVRFEREAKELGDLYPAMRNRRCADGPKSLGPRTEHACVPCWKVSAQQSGKPNADGAVVPDGRWARVVCLHLVRWSFSGADRSESGTIAHVSISNRRSGLENGWG